MSLTEKCSFFTYSTLALVQRTTRSILPLRLVEDGKKLTIPTT